MHGKIAACFLSALLLAGCGRTEEPRPAIPQSWEGMATRLRVDTPDYGTWLDAQSLERLPRGMGSVLVSNEGPGARPSPVLRYLMLAADVTRSDAHPPVDVLQVAFRLADGHGRTPARVLFWTPRSNLGGGWTSHPLPAARGGSVPGSAYVAVANATLSGGPIQWLDLQPHLRRAGVTGSGETLVLLDIPDSEPQLLATLKPRSQAFLLPYAKLGSVRVLGAVQTQLPAGAGRAVVPPSLHDPILFQGGTNRTVSTHIDRPAGSPIEVTLETGTVGTERAGHYVPRRLHVSIPGASGTAELLVFKGTRPAGRYPLRLNGSVDLTGLEDPRPRQWTSENSYRLNFFLRVNGQTYGVAHLVQGLQRTSIPSEGVTFLY